MARRVGSIQAGHRSFVTTSAQVDLGNTGAPTDIPTTMVCPGDGAKVVEVAYTVSTTGGDAENHSLVLEHGLGAAGAALTPTSVHANDDADGVIVTAKGLQPQDQPDTVFGTKIQIRNTEDGAIANGLILDVLVIWEL